MTWPTLDLVIPSHPSDARHLTRCLQSIQQQDYPHEQLRVFVVTQGDSEEAKGYGLLAGQGTFVCFLCTDNVLVERDTLTRLVRAADQEGVTGAYTTRYAYVPSDRPLSRYFALLGANDPLCWWLGLADRASYLTRLPGTQRLDFTGRRLPSLGDNGCVWRRAVLADLHLDPRRTGSLMCLAVDAQRSGHAVWVAVSEVAVWHRTGESVWTYLKKRTRYVDRLYFQRHALRRWRMVSTLRDWGSSGLFALSSLLLVPQMCVSLVGYRRVQDRSWFLHGPLCLALTLIYACLLMKHCMTSVWLSQPWIGRRS